MIAVSPSGLEFGKRFVASLRTIERYNPQSTEAPSTRPFGIRSTETFLKESFHHEWLIKDVLVKGQFAVVGGSQKTLKTSICVELAVSLTTATPFLGKFTVKDQRRVLFMSAESGGATLRDTYLRICNFKSVAKEKPDILWAFEIPNLSNSLDLKRMAEVIREEKIEVVFIDPLYLCLIDSKQAAQASNMFAMGPLLSSLMEACKQAGATPIVVHHTRKTNGAAGWSKFEPPELGDLAFSGLQQIVRQWLLVGRRKAFDPESGLHELWLTYGGSAGHASTWGLNITEGRLDSDFGGRTWQVRLMSRAQLESQREKEKESRWEDAQDQRVAGVESEVIEMLFQNEKGLTQSDIKAQLSKGKNKLVGVLTKLLKEKRISKVTIRKDGGRGKHEYAGYSLTGSPSPPPEESQVEGG